MADDTLEQDVRQISIDVTLPPRLVGQYATNFIVQHTDQEFYLYFFQARPPLILGSPEQQQKQVRELSEVPAECVGFILLAPDRVADLIRALTENYEKFRNSFAEEEGAT